MVESGRRDSPGLFSFLLIRQSLYSSPHNVNVIILILTVADYRRLSLLSKPFPSFSGNGIGSSKCSLSIFP